jgi:hypothetical protein
LVILFALMFFIRIWTSLFVYQSSFLVIADMLYYFALVPL